MKTYLQIIIFGILLVLGYPSLQACSAGTALALVESWRMLQDEQIPQKERETLVDLIQASAISKTEEERSCIRLLIKAFYKKLSRTTMHHDHEE